MVAVPKSVSVSKGVRGTRARAGTNSDAQYDLERVSMGPAPSVPGGDR